MHRYILAVALLLGGASAFAQEQAGLVLDLDSSRDAEAQFGLGVIYDYGINVPEDDAEAARWYRRSAMQGLAAAQYRLGWMHHTGRSVVRDVVEAAIWYRRAARQGYALAQSKLGEMYRNGEGVPKSDVKAYMWLNLAGAQGFDNARELRDLVARDMTPNQIAEAQQISLTCLDNAYKDC